MNIETLKQRVKPFEPFSTDYDKWGDRIDSNKLANARKAHNCEEQEYVFFLSDFSFWNNAKKSVIATNKGISLKYSDDLQALFVAWKDIYHVQGEGLVGVNVFSGGKSYEFNMFQSGIKDGYLVLLEDLINEETSTYEAEASAIDGVINKTVPGEEAKREITSAIQTCDRLLSNTLTDVESQYNKLEACGIYPCDAMGFINMRSFLLRKLGKTNQAKTDLLDFVDLCRRPDHPPYFFRVYFDACMELSDICTESKELDDAMVFLNLAASIEQSEWQREAKEELQSVKELKISYMLKSPRESREMILCIDDIPTWPVKQFGFATAEMLRSTKWIFEFGHPQTGEMYICHPLRSDRYYTVQSFHDRLFDDKRAELVYLLESIGARHVHVEAMEDTSEERQKDRTVEGKGSLEAGVAGGSLGISRETHDTFRHVKYKGAIEDRKLHPTAHPHVPEGLVWYPHDSSWQRIAQLALDKRYETLSVELHYYDDFSINQKRMTQVQAALKVCAQGLPIPIEIGWNQETEEHLQQKRATVWKYTATFGDETEDKQKSHVMDQAD